jgi:hypothetical protein
MRATHEDDERASRTSSVSKPNLFNNDKHGTCFRVRQSYTALDGTWKELFDASEYNDNLMTDA